MRRLITCPQGINRKYTFLPKIGTEINPVRAERIFPHAHQEIPLNYAYTEKSDEELLSEILTLPEEYHDYIHIFELTEVEDYGPQVDLAACLLTIKSGGVIGN